MNHSQNEIADDAGPESWTPPEMQTTNTRPEIAFRQIGSPEGTPLVLLHSLAVDQSTWGPVIASLKRRHRVITLDSRGHGSSGSADEMGPREWADDVLRVLDKLDIERAVLVGVSMGGIQAIATAATAPERVAGIVVADSFHSLPPEVARTRIQAMMDYASDHSMSEVAEKYVNDTFASNETQGRTLVVNAMGAMDRADYLRAVRACFGADVSQALAQIEAPTLVLWGELDEKTPRALSDSIAAGVKNSTIRVITGAGHLSHLDRPRAFASQISRFMAELHV